MSEKKKFLKTWVEIDSRAVAHNFRVVQKHVGKHVAVMCVVKSNAYGHGITEVAQILHTLRSFRDKGWFGVDSIDEALTLKKAGIKTPILILGYIPRPRLADAIKNGFRFALYSADVLKESARIAERARKNARVHIKIESGTYRQGLAPEELAELAHAFKNYPRVIPEGAYTHFADTEDAKSAFYKRQFAVFTQGIALLEEHGVRFSVFHAAASAALFLYPETHGTMVRQGISLYGMYPSADIQNRVSNVLPLQPALTWKTRIAQIKTVPKGETVGYNRRFTAQNFTRLAVLPVGYGDGFSRALSGRGSVLIGGKKVSVAGTVCMNMIMADITGVMRAVVGDEAVLIGRQGTAEITAEEVAEKADTINYEITTRINQDIPRILI
jgi:alanine racemase